MKRCIVLLFTLLIAYSISANTNDSLRKYDNRDTVFVKFFNDAGLDFKVSNDTIVLNLKDYSKCINITCGQLKESKDSYWTFFLEKLFLPIFLSILSALLPSILIINFRTRNIKIKQEEIIIQLKTENFKELYKMRLIALKGLKSITVKYFKTHIPLDMADISDVYAFIPSQANYISNELKEITLEYGYLFNKEIYERLLGLHIYSEDIAKTFNEKTPDEEFYEKGKYIFNELNDIIIDVEKLLLF